MIVASIDIGSNTVLLLIAEIKFDTKEINTLCNLYRAPRISKNLEIGNKISSNKISDLVEVLKEYKKICSDYKVEKLFAVATNAFRIAINSNEIIAKVKDEIGINIKVIDGEDEAQLSFLGTIHPAEKSIANTIIDIGGGSTEIIFGNNYNIIYKNSFQIGVVSLTEKILNEETITLNQIKQAEEFVCSVFNSQPIPIPPGIDTIAVAGTPTTLSCIKQNIKIYDEVHVDGSFLTLDEIYKMINKMYKLTPQKIKDSFGQVVEGREDVLLAGTIILKVLMEKLQINQIEVSSKGLRYGVIVEFLLNNSQ
jgi:exopolyphosphatase/guanosine-5'-triphosphate,3'-diphosphate pyrophosphatase